MEAPRDPERPRGPRKPGWTRRRPRTAAAAAGLLSLAAGAAFGWTASGAWGSTSERADIAQATAASATVVMVTGPVDAQGVARLDALVRVVNLGTLPFTVTGAEVSYLAAETNAVREVPQVVEPGQPRLVRLGVRLTCASPLPLNLPALSLRRADGLHRALPVDGATAELARVCAGGPASGLTLHVVSASPDGDRLKVLLDVPSGRTVRVVGVSAGQVPLTGRPIPGEVDGQGRTIWLDPPSACAVPWRTQGIPRGLEVALTGVSNRADATGVSAVLYLDLGYQLSGWLLAHGCAGSI